MQLGMPDAALPEGGLELRALVELSIDGATEIIQLVPGTYPPAFGKSLQLFLMSQRLQENGHGGKERYCLLARYAEGAQSVQLRWLPGRVRDTANCAAQPASLARDIAQR